MKVLVVEDDMDQLAVRSMLIEHNGFEALSAANSNSAMELATEGHPDCAVVDLRLPTEDAGLRLIRRLKDLDAGIHLIVLTGTDPAKLRCFPEATLIDDLLTKPTSSAELINKLKTVAIVSRD